MSNTVKSNLLSALELYNIPVETISYYRISLGSTTLKGELTNVFQTASLLDKLDVKYRPIVGIIVLTNYTWLDYEPSNEEAQWGWVYHRPLSKEQLLQ